MAFERVKEAVWCVRHPRECYNTRGAPETRQAYRNIHAGRADRNEEYHSRYNRDDERGRYNPPKDRHEARLYNDRVRQRGYYQTEEKVVKHHYDVFEGKREDNRRPVPGQKRLENTSVAKRGSGFDTRDKWGTHTNKNRGNDPHSAAAFAHSRNDVDPEHGKKVMGYNYYKKERVETGQRIPGTKEKMQWKMREDAHEINKYCAAFPDKCEAAKMNVKAAQLKRARYVEEALAAEKQHRNERIKYKILDSAPGKVIQAYGDAYYETKHVTKHVAKGVGKAIELQSSNKYVPHFKKAPKKKRRTPRRYRMTATNAINDVDNEFDRILGY